MSFHAISEVLRLLSENVILILLAAIPALYWYGTRNYNYWKKRGIPSPPAIPFLGSFYRLFTPTPLLHSAYVKKYGKVIGTFNGQRPVLLIAEPELIKRIFIRDFHLVRNRPESPARHHIFGLNLVAANGEMWKRQRSILNPMFSITKLKKMEEMMVTGVNAMIESLEAISISGKDLDVRDCMGNFTIDIIAKCAFATDTNAHKQNDNNPFVTAAKNFFDFRLGRFIFMSLVPRFIQRILVDRKIKPLFIEEYDFFESVCRHMIAKRRREVAAGIKHHDMLQLLLNAGKSAEEKKELSEDATEEEKAQAAEFKNIIGSKYLTEEEVMAQAMVFFLAGYETTANTLSYTMYELCVNTDIQERLYNEIQEAKKRDPQLSFETLNKLEYMDAVICEVLRKYCPASSVNREANTDYYIPEYDLKVEKGTFISVPIFVNHNSPEYWKDPEKFDPERFMGDNREKIVPYTYVPFSCGPRLCIGMKFSLMEAKLGLAQIMDRFEIVRTPKTFDKLEILQCMFLLKTSPIFVGVKKRMGK